MEQFVSQDPRSYSLYFDLNIWFRARKVTGTFEKRAPGPESFLRATNQTEFRNWHADERKQRNWKITFEEWVK